MRELKRKRGRPPTIDADAAMRAVVELFRSKGYAAVSLDELSEVTGLSRPSLYRSFGNKLSMYLRAIDAFGEQVVESAVPKLQDNGDLEVALTNFFSEMLNIYYRDDDIAPGCLVFGTAPSNADEAEIQSRLSFSIEQVDQLMRARMQKAFPARGSAQLDSAVHIASNTLIAFSARAKSGATKSELLEIGAQSAQAICTLLQGERAG